MNSKQYIFQVDCNSLIDIYEKNLGQNPPLSNPNPDNTQVLANTYLYGSGCCKTGAEIEQYVIDTIQNIQSVYFTIIPKDLTGSCQLFMGEITISQNGKPVKKLPLPEKMTGCMLSQESIAKLNIDDTYSFVINFLINYLNSSGEEVTISIAIDPKLQVSQGEH